MLTQKKRLTGILILVTLIILTPLVAMQFTDEVDWSVGDFIAVGILFYGAGLTVELILRNLKSFGKRFLFVGGTLFVVFLIWAQMAVGLLGKLLTGTL